MMVELLAAALAGGALATDAAEPPAAGRARPRTGSCSSRSTRAFDGGDAAGPLHRARATAGIL